MLILEFTFRNFSRKVFMLFLIFIFFSCEEDSNSQFKGYTGLSLVPSSSSGLNFKNNLFEDKDNNIIYYDYYYNGAGIAVEDFNNDGLPDLFFTANTSSNELFINKGDLKFENITKKAGIDSDKRWSTGVTTVDINEDGFQDIYVCNAGPFNGGFNKANQLFINNGDLTFTESSKEYGLDCQQRSNQASFFDYDKDGDLDLFISNNLNSWEPIIKDQVARLKNMSKDEYALEGNLFFKNENGRFVEATEEMGLLNAGYGLGLYTGDLNGDDQIDIYVTNDYWIEDFYYELVNGIYKQRNNSHTNHSSFYGMGIDVADITNDGLPEIFVLDMTPGDHVRNKTLMESMSPERFHYLKKELGYQAQYMFNTLQLNNGKGLFSEVGLYSGMSQTDWSWSTLFLDLDQDGLQDNIVTNGFLRDTKENDWLNRRTKMRDSLGHSKETFWKELNVARSKPINNFIFSNQADCKFDDKSKEWGFNKPSFSNGCIYADLDLDGDLDVVMNNINEEAFLFQNQAQNNFINFNFEDNKNKSRYLNTKLEIFYGGKKQYREIVKTRGYLSSVEAKAYFGIGKEEKVDKVVITWNNGSLSEILNPQINKTHLINFEKHQAKAKPKQKKNTTEKFIYVEKQILPEVFTHKENNYTEYDKEILLPHSQGALGPCLAKGDVNKDGLLDFFVGGASGQKAELYIQTNNSNFIKSNSSPWKKHIKSEDIGAAFFDVDGDKDLDLYVSSGGGGYFEDKKELLQDRLYINDSKGNFSISSIPLPDTKTSNGTVKPFDFDKDGDVDLFVCGRTSPGKYPFPSNSYLLKNENGTLVDATKDLIEDLNPAGMVTDMIWTDQDGDGLTDIMLVGEWMSITFLKNTGEIFINKSSSIGLENLEGWWYSIEQSDIDNDGDMDYIVGNLGLNNKFHPSEKKPFHVYCNDFDDNGTYDIVLSKDYKGKFVPVRGKECSTEQMPFLEEKFETYLEFASASIEELYSKEKLNESLHYEVKSFESILLISENGSLKKQALPIQCQMAPINSIIAKDFDGDKNVDLLLAGNNFNTEAETPTYDAGMGKYLKGKGNGEFEVMSLEATGIVLPYNLKNMIDMEFKFRGRMVQIVIAANNNGPIQILGYKG